MLSLIISNLLVVTNIFGFYTIIHILMCQEDFHHIVDDITYEGDRLGAIQIQTVLGSMPGETIPSQSIDELKSRSISRDRVCPDRIFQ